MVFKTNLESWGAGSSSHPKKAVLSLKDDSLTAGKPARPLIFDSKSSVRSGQALHSGIIGTKMPPLPSERQKPAPEGEADKVFSNPARYAGQWAAAAMDVYSDIFIVASHAPGTETVGTKSGGTVEKEYNGNGKPIKMVVKDKDGNVIESERITYKRDEKGEITSATTTIYDGKNRKCGSKEYHKNGEVIYRDKNGRVLYKTIVDPETGRRKHVDAKGNPISDEKRYKYNASMQPKDKKYKAFMEEENKYFDEDMEKANKPKMNVKG